MLEFIDISDGKSLFKFMPTVWYARWTSNNRAFHKLCSLMRKMGAETAIIEDINPDCDMVREEREALCRYFDSNIEIKIFRVSFCTAKIGNEEALKKPDVNNIFLANTIIVNFKVNDMCRAYLFSSIVSIPMIKPKKGEMKHVFVPLLNNYINSAREFDCQIKYSNQETYTYKIFGTYFCQQNTFTSVCAHAAVCMAVNNFGGLSTGLITPEYLNKDQSFSIDHKSRKVGKEGNVIVDDKMIKKFVDSKGLLCKALDFSLVNDYDYNEYLYNYMESRHPCLLVFSTQQELVMHVVPIVGHTLNTDLWTPEAEIAYSNNSKIGVNTVKKENRDSLVFKSRSTSAWVDHFVIHDDNFGMYYCLPVDLLKRKSLLGQTDLCEAVIGLVIMPKGTKTGALEANKNSVAIMCRNLEKIGSKYANKTTNYWIEELLSIGSSGSSIYCSTLLVTRTLLVNKNDYLDNLNGRDFENHYFSTYQKDRIMEGLPETFWLTEITLPDLYTANKTKIVDVCYKKDEEEYDCEKNWIQTRLPGVLLNKSTSQPIPLDVLSHYPLFRFKEIREVYEW